MVSADLGPVALAAAVLVQDGRVLLVPAAHPPGTWDWPQGPVGAGEPLAAAALRILAAAAGITATAVRPLLPQERIVRDEGGRLVAHAVLFPVLCHWPVGAGEGAACAWWDVAAPAAATLPLAPGVAALAAAAAALGS